MLGWLLFGVYAWVCDFVGVVGLGVGLVFCVCCCDALARSLGITFVWCVVVVLDLICLGLVMWGWFCGFVLLCLMLGWFCCLGLVGLVVWFLGFGCWRFDVSC